MKSNNLYRALEAALRGLDEALANCNGRIDVSIIDYGNNMEDPDMEDPDIYTYDDISKDEVYRLNNELDDSLEMQVYCNGNLIYVE